MKNRISLKKIFVLLILLVFILEFSVMFVAHKIGFDHFWYQILFDSLVLCLFLTPFFYFIFYKPINNYFHSALAREREDAEKVQKALKEEQTANEEIKATEDQLQRNYELLEKREEEARKLASEWDDTFNAITDFIFIVNRKHEFTKVNRAFCRAVNKEPHEIIGKKCYEVMPCTGSPRSDCPVTETLQDCKGHRKELNDSALGMPLLVNTCPVFDDSKKLSEVVYIARDLTEIRKSEQIIIKNQRLAAIGEASSGIAHDFNNTLQGIISRSEIMLSNKWVSDLAKDNFKKIKNAAEQASKRIRSLLSFTGYKNPEGKPEKVVDIDSLIDETIRQISPFIQNIHNKNNVKYNIERNRSEGCFVECCKVELVDTVFNLLKNSLESMPDGGILTVSTEKKSKNVIITISDTGTGMDKKTAIKAFEPFFTTKEVGTGVGLSGAYSTVKEHGGTIFIKNTEVNKGTTFQIELPLSSGSPDGDPKHKKASETKEVRDLKVLWVDDDEGIRDSGKVLLEIIGHDVEAAESGAEALKMLKAESYDVVITDVCMPEMSGWQLSEEINEQYPDVKVVILSGWNTDKTQEELSRLGIVGVAQKPLTKDGLSDLLNDVCAK